MQLFKSAIYTAILASLTACGGGGGGSDDPAAPQTPQPETPEITTPGATTPEATPNVPDTTSPGTQPSTPDTPAEGTTPTGNLLGIINEPGVEIAIAGQTTTTDDQGRFLLNNLAFTAQNRWVITLEKDGFVSTQKIVDTQASQTQYVLNAQIFKADFTQAVDLSTTQTITTPNNNLSISIPANAIEGGDANSVISLTYGDPSTEQGRALFPGDFSATNAQNQPADITLESITFTDISVENSTGEDLTTLTTPADVTLLLPSIYQTGGSMADRYQHGDTIAWWSYDEVNGVWLREDANPSTPEVDDAQVIEEQGQLFAKAQVTHFSWWNVDEPIETHACITVQVLDGSGAPAPNIWVETSGVSYQSSVQDTTDLQGYASLAVKRSTLETTETFTLFAKVGDLTIPYDVTSITEGDVTTDTINTPTIQGSTKNGSGECVTLENPITIVYRGKVEGTVTLLNGAPAANIVLYTTANQITTTNASGYYSFDIPYNNDIYVYTEDEILGNVITSADSPVATLNYSLGNTPPKITSVEFNEDEAAANASILFTATATDLESTALTYQWTTSQGTFNTQNIANPTLTLGNTTSGASTITLTVTDEQGLTAKWQTRLTWSDDAQTIPQTGFFVRVHAHFPSVDLSGITVVMHAADGKGIAETKLTDEQGIANFGDIELPVTVTTIETIPGQFEFMPTRYQINTFAEVTSNHLRVDSYRYDESLLGLCDEADHIIFQFTVKNLPDGVTSAQVHGQPITVLNDTQVHEVAICPETLHGSNLFTAVVYASSNTGAQTEKYNVLLEQNKVTEVDLAASPPTIALTNNTGLAVASTLIGVNSDYTAPIGFGTGNTIELLTNTTYDSYLVSLNNYLGNEIIEGVPYYRVSRIVDELPSTLTFDPIDLRAGNYAFNATTKTASWSVLSQSQPDNIDLQLESLNSQWSIMLPGDARTYQLPDLPEQFSSIFDETLIFQHLLSLAELPAHDSFYNVLDSLYHYDELGFIWMPIEVNSVDYYYE